METRKSVAGWLICVDGPYEGKVLLQQRSDKEVRDGKLVPQSYPYLCQPTWHGTVNPHERIYSALVREAREELGSAFASSFHWYMHFFFRGRYALGTMRGADYNFVGTVSQDDLGKIRLHAGACQKFVAVDGRDLEKIKIFERGKNVDLKTNVVTFKEHRSALRKLIDLRDTLVCLR